MGVTSEILGNSCPAHVLEHGGVKLSVRLIDQAAKADFEKRRFSNARSALALVADDLTREEYADRLAGLATKHADGEYEMISTQGLQYITTVQGALFLLSILTGRPTEVLVPVVMAKQAEVKMLLRTVLAESFPGLVFKDDKPAADKPVVASKTTDPNG